MTEAAERESSWPLLTLAILSFLPGAGFVCGSLAVTWGLLSDRPRARLAIGIGATGAFLQLIAFAIIVASRGPDAFRIGGVLSELTREYTRQNLVTVVEGLERYHRQESVYPENLQQLKRSGSGRFISIEDLSGGVSGGAYQYHRSPDGSSYDLFAVGPDGEPGTADDVRPLLPEALRKTSGYRPGQ